MTEFSYVCGNADGEVLHLSGFDFSSIPFFGPLNLSLSSLFFPHLSAVFSFLRLFPDLAMAQVKHKPSLSLQTHPEPPTRGHSCVSDSLPAKSESCQLSHSSHYNPLTHLRQQASRCAAWMAFLRTNYYMFSCSVWNPGSNPPQFPIFQFYKNSYYYFLPVARNLSLNSFCAKLLCEYGFSLFKKKKLYLFYLNQLTVSCGPDCHIQHWCLFLHFPHIHSGVTQEANRLLHLFSFLVLIFPHWFFYLNLWQ